MVLEAIFRQGVRLWAQAICIPTSVIRGDTEPNVLLGPLRPLCLGTLLHHSAIKALLHTRRSPGAISFMRVGATTCKSTRAEYWSIPWRPPRIILGGIDDYVNVRVCAEPLVVEGWLHGAAWLTARIT